MSIGNNRTDYDGMNLPYNMEAEQSVLGAVLIDSSCLDIVAQILPTHDYFYVSNHKIIYEVMLEMFSKGEPIDYVTTLENLKKQGSINDSECREYLLKMAHMVPSLSNVEVYANIVKNKYNVRTLILAAREIIEDAVQSTMDDSELLDSAEQRIFDIRQGKETKGLQPIKEILLQAIDKLDALNSPEANKHKGLSTGIKDLDRVILGLNKSDLILLAARPGMGKTSFALNIASHVSGKLQKKVAFFSLEMSKEQLVSRMISSQSRISNQNLKTGDLSSDEWIKIIEASDVLGKAKLFIDDTAACTIPEMKAKIRRLRDVGLVVIDYLQLMSSAKRIDNRVQEISDITRNLKIMAKEFNVPVITLSQLSRASEQRNDHRPLLSDLRDSGSIEQDADIVMFLYRQGYYSMHDMDENADRNAGECIVAKNRHGETRSVGLHWEGEFLRFTAQEHHYE